MRINGAIALSVLGMALFAASQAHAQAPEPQPPELNRADLTPAALQGADALLEKYLQPIPSPAPTLAQRRAIDSAMTMLKSEDAMKGQAAIERFLQIGPAALGDLRQLAAAPTESAAAGTPTADAYSVTMAAIVVRRIEAAQRQPVVQELISLGDGARAALSMKLAEDYAAAAAALSRVSAATAALPNDAPPDAPARQALAAAQAEQNQVLARRDMLLELQRLLTPVSPPQPPPAPQPPPETPPPSVLNIRTQSPPTGSFSFDDESQDMDPFDYGSDGPGIIGGYSHRGAESHGAAHVGGGGGGGAHSSGGGGAGGGGRNR